MDRKLGEWEMPSLFQAGSCISAHQVQHRLRIVGIIANALSVSIRHTNKTDKLNRNHEAS